MKQNDSSQAEDLILRSFKLDALSWELLDMLPGAVYLVDHEGVMLRWNKRAVALWGREPKVGDRSERFCGSYKLYRMDGTFMAHSDCPVADTLATGRPNRNIEAIIERPDGSRRFILANMDAVRNGSGRIEGVINILQDVSEKKLAEDALKQSQGQLKRVLDSMPAAAYTCDAGGLITYYNQKAVELWGRAPKLNDVTDKYCGSFKLFSTDGKPIQHSECWMALALRNGGEYIGREILIERPDGSKRFGLAHACPFFDSGRVIGAVNILVDITEQKKIEATLRDADRRKDEFLATLAHELRNPLAPIRNCVHIIKSKKSNDPILQSSTGVIERQVTHLTKLVDDLLEVSRISQGKLQLNRRRTTLQSVLEHAIETVQPHIQTAQHQLVVTKPSDPIYLDADPLRLAQCVSNLLHNACKYTPSQGIIKLSANVDNWNVRIAVRDNGTGISSEHIPQLFLMFSQVDCTTTRSQGGLGVGLALVRGIVDLHGGKVAAFSEGIGKGSEFIIDLPISQQDHSEADPSRDLPCRGAPLNLRILVVDDNQDSASSLSIILEQAGNSVLCAHDGLIALSLAEEYRPDVVLMDIGMPKLDGYDACRKFRQQPWGRDILLVAVTGWGAQTDRKKASEAGFNAHLVKPVDPEGLLKLLGELMRNKPV